MNTPLNSLDKGLDQYTLSKKCCWCASLPKGVKLICIFMVSLLLCYVNSCGIYPFPRIVAS